MSIEDSLKEAVAKSFEAAFKDLAENPGKYADEHRKDINDMEWADMQPKGKPKYGYGDIVEFKVGGFGRIDEVTKPANGWPSSYSVMEVPGMKFHAEDICAWHYEGDILGLKKKASKEVRQVMAQMKNDHQQSMAAHAMRDLKKDS